MEEKRLKKIVRACIDVVEQGAEMPSDLLEVTAELYRAVGAILIKSNYVNADNLIEFNKKYIEIIHEEWKNIK